MIALSLALMANSSPAFNQLPPLNISNPRPYSPILQDSILSPRPSYNSNVLSYGQAGNTKSPLGVLVQARSFLSSKEYNHLTE